MASPKMSPQERQLCEYLRDMPRNRRYRYDAPASHDLLLSLFWSLAGGKEEYMKLFFPEGTRPSLQHGWKLRHAQGAVNGAEYTEGARGKACGHIFKTGEATYRCKTCSTDNTCVLCSRCYDSSDHTGHMVYISISPGNSGCCDCGDPEAWRLPVHCTIHSEDAHAAKVSGKARAASALPTELHESISMTIGRALDYVCDIVSSSPENLRLPRSDQSVREDERNSRLISPFYGGDLIDEQPEFAILLWNDEKHTINEVRDQVARACKVPLSEGLLRATETNDIGRAIVKYDTDLDNLLRIARVIEHIKVTVTIRSSRDTFREQMVGTIVEWLADIAGCRVGDDHNILRQIVCRELLEPWRSDVLGENADIGHGGIDDQELWDREHTQRRWLEQTTAAFRARARETAAAAAVAGDEEDDDEEDDEEDDDMVENDLDEEDDDDLDGEASGGFDFQMFTREFNTPPPDTELPGPVNPAPDVVMGEDALEAQEATLAGYPAPPPPPADRADNVHITIPTVYHFAPIHDEDPTTRPRRREQDSTPSDSDTGGDPLIHPQFYARSYDVPRTPAARGRTTAKSLGPPRYWLQTPEAFHNPGPVEPYEDLFRSVRIDHMISYDLRMWKKLRIDLRDLYISTVVTVPAFKRVLGLRFAGLYTLLAQLYLIADREPDHSIINISLQMLTTPTITKEIVERGNFFTNLMAILYTFLTTRQVDGPAKIDPNATLNFDNGSVTNRRMYHFFMDLRYLFNCEYIQQQMQVEERYMMQFLDLAKLHQGICPNTRAVGEHVEYETDAWISASLITREVNRLCRQFCDAFHYKAGEDTTCITKAIRLCAKSVILNSIGIERGRFAASEIKEEIRFKCVSDYEFESPSAFFVVVDFHVDQQPISFHHPLHYILSWLIENGKNLTQEQLKAALSFTELELFAKPMAMGTRTPPGHASSISLSAEDYLVGAFDYPLRVCAWLAQMKAGMWVRNGMSLRHQAGTYKGVTQRDVSHHRDVFLLQTAMVVCQPGRILAGMIDRYGMEHWMKGIFEQRSDIMDDAQQLDVVEDMLHLLIIILSDRTCLHADEDSAHSNSHGLSLRRDIIHVLCFKPLSFTEISAKLPDKFQEQDECQEILDDMTTYKPPEGLSDVGTFELREEFLEELDPYIAHYNRNQREESENAYKRRIAKKTGRHVDDVVFEPTLRPIVSGAFRTLPAFTSTGIFAQIVYYSLVFCLKSNTVYPKVPVTRIETFLQVVLHLTLLAVAEDTTTEKDTVGQEDGSFVSIALARSGRTNLMRSRPDLRTIVALLELLNTKEEFKTCQPKVKLILRRMRQKRPRAFEDMYGRMGFPVDRVNTASPAKDVEADKLRLKKAALDRQARVMASFQEQQKSFLDNQGDIDWDEDDASSDDIEMGTGGKAKKIWKYPSGTCILCQEETNESRPYGTFALIAESRILRQTDFTDPEVLQEVADMPLSLDRSADELRPFGVSGRNKTEVKKINALGEEIFSERHFIGKGFKSKQCKVDPVSVGCGHIMHYKCFGVYYEACNRRHHQQIARHHPERLELNEFVCPLCKAQGNAFFPIIWKGQEELSPDVLAVQTGFEEWLTSDIPSTWRRARKNREPGSNGQIGDSQLQELFSEYNSNKIVPSYATKLDQDHLNPWMHSRTPIGVVSQAALSRTNEAIVTARTPGAFPSDDAEVDLSSEKEATSDPVVIELAAIYRRLANTIRLNKLNSRFEHEPAPPVVDGIYSVDTLFTTLGMSIATAEIMQRGVASVPGQTFLETMPQQTITHLRVLSETAVSFVFLTARWRDGKNRVAEEFSNECDSQFLRLFLGHPAVFSLHEDNFDGIKVVDPLLREDIFVFLTKASLGIVPALRLDIMHVVRLCYIAEIVKVVMLLNRNSPYSSWQPLLDIGTVEGTPFLSFASSINIMDKSNHDRHPVSPRLQEYPGYNSVDVIERQKFVEKYAVVFLRKCLLLLHVRHAIDFSMFSLHDTEAPELDRLTQLLQLPTLNELYTTVAFNRTEHTELSALRNMIGFWIAHAAIDNNPAPVPTNLITFPPTTPPINPLGLSVSHPVIYELIGLPKHYDTLMEAALQQRCPTTGKDISDPMLCLFCGEIFCGQAICCLRDEYPRVRGQKAPAQIGGAQQHMLKCQRTIGLYINIRKCCVYYLHDKSGSWTVAPYVDKYGEVDPGLRHSRPLVLHQKRYDALLRTVWLQHGIPSVIARKLEQDVNNGGWETV